MYNSERLMAAVGELPDELVERAGLALGYQKRQRIRRAVRMSRLLGAAAAIVLVLGLSVTAYPVYIHWSRGMQQKLSATGEEQIYAQDSGLSETMPDGMTQAAAAKNESTEESAVYDSAAAGFSAVNGVTISVEQTVIDSNSARIALRIEGFMLPDGAYPDIGPGWQLTFGGERATNMTGGFVEGRDAEDRLIFTDTDGSLEFDFHASDTRTGFSFEGKEISLVIDSLGTGDKGQYEPLVEGPWELHWTPVGN